MKNFMEQNWDRMASAYEGFTEGDDSYSRTIEWPNRYDAYLQTPSFMVFKIAK